MQIVKINSFFHYKVVDRDGRLVLLEFGDDCPEMGHRDPYHDDEGEGVGSWECGEAVKFVYDFSLATWLTDEERADEEITVAVVPPTPGDRPWCGDDFRYHLLDAAV